MAVNGLSTHESLLSIEIEVRPSFSCLTNAGIYAETPLEIMEEVMSSLEASL